MSGLQEEYLQHKTAIGQLKLSVQYMRWYLLSLSLLCLVSYLIFSYFFSSYLTAFAYSTAITIGSFLFLFFISKFLSKHKQTNFIPKTDLILQCICFISGMFVGGNIIVIHFFLPPELVTVPDFHILIALFLTSAHIIGLTFLTHHPRYFYLLFVPSVVP